jgi:hypothetical protein
MPLALRASTVCVDACLEPFLRGGQRSDLAIVIETMPLDFKRKRRELANDGIDNERGASILWLHFPKADAMSGLQ